MTLRPALLLTILCLMSVGFAADIGLSPPRIEVAIPRGGTVTEVVSLISTGGKAQELAVSKGDWAQDESGRIAFLPPGQGDFSATSWVTLSSDVLALPADGQSRFRFTVSVPSNDALRGTYRTVVFFETSPSAPQKQGNTIRMKQRLGLILYVTVAGTEVNGSKVSDMYAEGQTIHAIVSNTGNTLMRYSGSIEVRDSAGATVTSVPLASGPILRESDRDVSVAMPDLPTGYYVLLLLLKDSRGGLLTGQLPYEVK